MKNFKIVALFTLALMIISCSDNSGDEFYCDLSNHYEQEVSSEDGNFSLIFSADGTISTVLNTGTSVIICSPCWEYEMSPGGSSITIDKPDSGSIKYPFHVDCQSITLDSETYYR